ncbi:MAG: Cna B-type domain-containing protein [Clostridia bacterium]|nr:Cna B-type domain-containing protein [Clostridia bacterium]
MYNNKYKMEMEVINTWDDNNNEASKRPKSVTLQVKLDGKVVREAKVSKKDEWRHVFELPKYDELGNEIEYTVDIKETEKYYKKRIEEATIINTYI